MPKVTDDERGRRIFQIHKERAVEGAVAKIRQNLGSDWAQFSGQDIETLHYILGEAWVSIERSVWEQCAFTRLSRNDLKKIITVGYEVKSKHLREEIAIDEICGILKYSICG